MTDDQIAGSIYLGLCLVLVASSLVIRRLPSGKLASLAAVWVALILGLWGLVVLVRG